MLGSIGRLHVLFERINTNFNIENIT